MKTSSTSGRSKVDKVVDLEQALDLVSEGALLALGGNLLWRVPAAFVRGIARRGVKGLRLLKTAASYDFDLLCTAGCVAEVITGYVGYENEFGFARGYRRAVEEGRVRVREHA